MYKRKGHQKTSKYYVGPGNTCSIILSSPALHSFAVELQPVEETGGGPQQSHNKKQVFLLILTSRLQYLYTTITDLSCVLQSYLMPVQIDAYTPHTFLSTKGGMLHSFGPSFLPISWQAIHIKTHKSAPILFNGCITFH